MEPSRAKPEYQQRDVGLDRRTERMSTKIGTVVSYPHPELVCNYFNMYIKISRFSLDLLSRSLDFLS